MIKALFIFKSAVFDKPVSIYLRGFDAGLIDFITHFITHFIAHLCLVIKSKRARQDGFDFFEFVITTLNCQKRIT